MIPSRFVSVCVRAHAQVCVRCVKPSPFIPPPPGQHSFFTCEFTRLHLHVAHEFILSGSLGCSFVCQLVAFLTPPRSHGY